VADVVDDLTSTDTDKALSANQGKVLQDGKEPADATILKEADIVDNLTSTSTTAPLSANQGKVLQDGKLNLSGGTMTGDLTIPDKIIHSGDTDTAIRFPSADTVTVETGGTERMRVDSSGNVGIGTSSYSSKLAVRDESGNINEQAVFSNAGTFHTGIAFTSTTNYLTDGNGWGIYGGPNTYLTSLAHRVAVVIPTGVPDFSVITGNTNLNSSNGTPKFTVTQAGDVGIGTTSPATKLDVNGSIRASTGILFGTDTAAANTLDDYEEGTFDFGIAFGGASVAMTYSARGGKYTKIGRQVTVTGYIGLTNKGTSTGIATITGLPFTVFNSDANYSGISVGFLSSITFADYIQGYVDKNTTKINLVETTNAGVLTTLSNADFANNSEIVLSLTYFTS
jgi:hypothetical protein